ncbi:MAG: glutathione S-transferase family protein [Pseudomonadota bacterium]
MKLYASYLSPFSARVLIQSSIKDVHIPLAEPTGGLGSTAYKQINPLGKIPALETNDGVIIESEVICDWIEERFPKPNLAGSTPMSRAEIRQLARSFDIYVMNAMLPIFSQMDPQTRNEDIVNGTLNNVIVGLEHSQALLARAESVGRVSTLADCMAAPTLLFCETFLPMFAHQDTLKAYPSLHSYWLWLQEEPKVLGVLNKMRTAIAQSG